MYKGIKDYSHKEDKLGILLVNLGTPESPTAKDLRPYLRRFLNDTRVIENRKLWWKILLNFIIIPIRSPKSAAAYSKIWLDGSSPLYTYSNSITTKLQQSFKKRFGDKLVVSLGMSYSKPTINSALNDLRRHNITKLMVLPLYPQYSCSTVASVFDAVACELRQWRLVPDLRFIHSYHDEPSYISAIAKSIREFRAQHNSDAMLIFSFHGMPLTSLLDGDPYHCQCHKTARLVAAKLKIKNYKVCFQSRFGKAKWLQPYTDKTLAALPSQGIKKAQLICPGFAVDCVETLEEINQEARDIFLQAGGKDFAYIPCLNDSEEHIKLLRDLALVGSADMLTKLERVNKDLKKTATIANALRKKDYYLPE